jgi:methionyl-tRNA formyltransferase
VRVVFVGTPDAALPALEAILAAGHEVPLVVTQPDRPSGRSKTPQPTPVKALAAARGLTVIQPEKVRTPEFLQRIAAARPDALAVVAYGRILTRPVLDAAPHGAINVHFSLLPALRGAAPVQWALARGESGTGVTTFRLDDGLDTGDILRARRVAIAAGEHAPALLARLAVEGASLLVETLRGLAAGSIEPKPQEHGRATAAPILTRRDGSWDPAWSARALEGRVRGFDPWPGVWALLRGRRLRIVEARALTETTVDRAAGGVIDLEDGGFHLACADGTIAAVDVVQPEGGRTMSAREAANGRLLRTGDRLEPPEHAA